MTARAPHWLTARPIAHRGLHDAAAGIIENTPSSVIAAIGGNYAIEVDLQISSDGEAMVHHDDDLGRLTDGHGTLAAMTAAAIRTMPFKATSDRIVSLGELCDLVAGRTPLILELKSRFDGDLRVAERAVQVLAGYSGPVAAMSFDPTLVTALRRLRPALPRGIVAERRLVTGGAGLATAWINWRLAMLTHAPRSRPHFVAYSVNDLPALGPALARTLFGCPLLTWTVRTPADMTRARRHADQMIFEGFRP
ncbi:MAG TPA: glycerophosphodiester phosphodiesterase family protein [Pseudolabrys sp.]|nr:glycerophosphodiester phosphodiesterase family protein [Pseudolabrys sp.]